MLYARPTQTLRKTYACDRFHMLPFIAHRHSPEANPASTGSAFAGISLRQTHPLPVAMAPPTSGHPAAKIGALPIPV